MALRAEGWIGIPHGGIGMGMLVELASQLESTDSSIRYPFSVDFRMGGSRLRIGDKALVEVSAAASGAAGQIVPASGGAPYISAVLSRGTDSERGIPELPPYLPATLFEIENKLLPLPFYKNCFVCGVEREDPGLRRKFHLLDGPDERVVVSLAGFEVADSGSFYLFQRNGRLHPLPLLALIDETAGWAGFMISANGGVTTRISYTFFRAVMPGEKIAVFAKGDKLRRTSTRTMFWASGIAAVIKGNGKFEVVATAEGQYFGMQELTDQMRTELKPIELTKRSFEIAETPPGQSGKITSS